MKIIIKEYTTAIEKNNCYWVLNTDIKEKSSVLFTKSFENL